jgi:MFS family permease
VLAFAMCAIEGGLPWFTFWRGLAGVGGGFLMALAGPAVQASVTPDWRGTAGGLVMGGAGGGIIAASLLVPLLLEGGLVIAWLGLAVATALVWALIRPRWPDPPALPAAEAAQKVPPAWRLLIAYGLSGAGMVAPMVYLADLAVRARGLPIEAAAAVWMGFGAGAIAGTLLGGRFAGRHGGRRVLPAWLAVQVAALTLGAAAPGGRRWRCRSARRFRGGGRHRCHPRRHAGGGGPAGRRGLGAGDGRLCAGAGGGRLRARRALRRHRREPCRGLRRRPRAVGWGARGRAGRGVAGKKKGPLRGEGP